MHTSRARGRGRGRARPRPRQGAAAARGRPGAAWRSGISDAEGRIKPSRQAKYRQVEEFLRLLDASITDALDKGTLRRPTAEDPLRIVDLGCGNAYLTFAAHATSTDVRGLPVAADRCRRQGAVARAQRRGRRRARHRTARLRGRHASAASSSTPAPEVVLALHACDTATDEALARAVEWEAPLVLAAPCCHHDIAAQLRAGADPGAVRHAHPARHPARAVRRHPDRRAAGLADAAAGLPGRRGAVRREPAHAAQHDAARGPHRRPGQGRRRAQGVRRPGRDLGRARRSSPSCWATDVRERLLGRRDRRAVRWSAPPLAPGRRRPATWSFRFQDPAIVESSGLVVRRRAGRHRQRLRRQRPGLRRRPGRRQDRRRHHLGRRADRRRGAGPGRPTARSGSATSATTPPPATSIERDPGAGRPRRPAVVGRRRTTLVYPDGPHDAETLLAHPRPGGCFVVTKDVFGGDAVRRAAAAPRGRAQPAAAGRRRVRASSPTARSSPTAGTACCATTAGRSSTFPSLEPVGAFDLPAQKQGEGIAVGARRHASTLSSEGVRSRGAADRAAGRDPRGDGCAARVHRAKRLGRRHRRCERQPTAPARTLPGSVSPTPASPSAAPCPGSSASCSSASVSWS